MTQQETVEFTIDYIRNRTEGIPDEFLPDIGVALQEGMKMKVLEIKKKCIYLHLQVEEVGHRNTQRHR